MFELRYAGLLPVSVVPANYPDNLPFAPPPPAGLSSFSPEQAMASVRHVDLRSLRSTNLGEIESCV